MAPINQDLLYWTNAARLIAFGRRRAEVIDFVYTFVGHLSLVHAYVRRVSFAEHLWRADEEYDRALAYVVRTASTELHAIDAALIAIVARMTKSIEQKTLAERV